MGKPEIIALAFYLFGLWVCTIFIHIEVASFLASSILSTLFVAVYIFNLME